LTFLEIDLLGVYVAPISLLIIAAWFVTIGLRRIADLSKLRKSKRSAVEPRQRARRARSHARRSRHHPPPALFSSPSIQRRPRSVWRFVAPRLFRKCNFECAVPAEFISCSFKLGH
jgi:hypothetical protein